MIYLPIKSKSLFLISCKDDLYIIFIYDLEKINVLRLAIKVSSFISKKIGIFKLYYTFD
jgi:hypothetical protein